MASKGKIEETVAYEYYAVERFAYEVFAYSIVQFGVPQSCVSNWEGTALMCEHRPIILAMSRIFFKYQITQRKSWSCEFNSYFLLNRFREVRLTQHVLMAMLSVSMKSVVCVRHKILISLAVMNEFILFLYSNNCNLYLKDLAKFYEGYMTTSWEKFEVNGRLPPGFEKYCTSLKEFREPGGVWKEFEESGGLNEMFYSIINPKLDAVLTFYQEFIPEFCVPYHNEDKLPSLNYTFYDKSVTYFRNLTKDIPRKHRKGYNYVFNATIWHDCRISPRIDLIEGYSPRLGILTVVSHKVFLSQVFKIPETEIWRLKPRNTEPLLPHFDRWLKQFGVNMKCYSYLRSFQSITDTSRQEEAGDRRRPDPEKGRRTKSTSTAIVEEFGKLNLGPSGISPWSLKPESIGFQIGSSSDTHTSRQQKERHRRQGARRKTKSGSYSIVEDFSQFNLSSPETESLNPNPINIGLQIQSPEELLRDTNVSGVDAATSLNPPQEVTKSQRGSNQGAIPKARYTSYSKVEDLSQCNLNPLETKSWSSKRVNVGVEIRSPKESLRDVDVSVVDADTSSQNRPDTRPQEAAGERRASVSPEEGEIRKSSSLLSLEEGFAQLNLNPSESKSSSPEPENIGLGISPAEESHRVVDVSVVDAATSSQNHPDTRPREVATDLGRTITPEEVEIRKSSSLLSLEESFEQLNLGPSDTESSGEEKK